MSGNRIVSAVHGRRPVDPLVLRGQPIQCVSPNVSRAQTLQPQRPGSFEFPPRTTTFEHRHVYSKLQL